MSTAVISPCGTFRYSLRRHWFADQPPLVFVMLNPSTADACANDPTIRKCIGFAVRAGFGGIVVVNLFAYRATDPRDLRKAFNAGADVVGPDNDTEIYAACRGRCVVLAWGANARRSPERVKHVEALVYGCASVVRALDVLADGTPKHPLLIPYARATQMVGLSCP